MANKLSTSHSHVWYKNQGAKILLPVVAVGLGLSLGSGAKAAALQTDANAKYRTITRDANNDYVYITEPEALMFDAGQSDALKEAIALLSTQLSKVTGQYTPAMDPSGDLKALVDATNTFNKNLDQLVSLTSSLYGGGSASPIPWGEYLGEQFNPTGFILFLTAEYNKDVVRVPYLQAAVQGGGSVTLGMVFVPQKVTRISVPKDSNSKPLTKTYTRWSTNVVIIPTINAGAGVSVIGGGTNVRYGLGLIFGGVSSAADVAGLTFGGSATFDVPALAKLPGALKGDGINLKVLALKNSAKTGAITNMLVLAGIEDGVIDSPKNNQFLNVQLESHFNLSYIWDLTTTISSVGSYFSGAQILPR